jgi:hypothetical protein
LAGVARQSATQINGEGEMDRFARLAVTFFLCCATALAFLPAKGARAEEVYLFRGLMDVFSDGMNQMNSQLKARGVRASVHSDGAWAGVAQDIIGRAKRNQVSFPIVILGHSIAGNSIVRLANTLGSAGVPVELVIGFDPGFPRPPAFGRGARRVINFKISSGHDYRRATGFAGSIQNIDISTFTDADHVGVDKDRRVQQRAIALVMATIGR